MTREKMKTIGGMSVRAEIDRRVAEARTSAIEEVIVFLGGSGFSAAAEALQHAAFGEQGEGRND